MLRLGMLRVPGSLRHSRSLSGEQFLGDAPSGPTLDPAQICCSHSLRKLISFAKTLTKPSAFTPKCIYDPGELFTPPVCRVYHRSAPPRRLMAAMMTSGRNHSQPPVPSRWSAAQRVPCASTTKKTDEVTRSPL